MSSLIRVSRSLPVSLFLPRIPFIRLFSKSSSSSSKASTAAAPPKVDIKKIIGSATKQAREEKPAVAKPAAEAAAPADDAEAPTAPADDAADALAPGEQLSKSDRQRLIEKAKKAAKQLSTAKPSGMRALQRKAESRRRGLSVDVEAAEPQEEKKEEIKTVYLNNAIPFHELIVIAADGSRLGRIKKRDAVTRANESDLDLMLVTPIEEIQNPVAKIINYKLFARQEREKKAKSQTAKPVVQKTIGIRPQIGDGDYETKLAQAMRFLQKGYRVKFNYQTSLAVEPDVYMPLFNRIAERLSHVAVSEDIDNEEKYCTFHPITNKAKKNNKEKPDSGKSASAPSANGSESFPPS